MNESKTIEKTESSSIAAILKAANIDNNTREYLILIGELHDINARFEGMIIRDWGEDNTSSFTEPFRNSMDNVIKEVEKVFLDTFLSVIT